MALQQQPAELRSQARGNTHGRAIRRLQSAASSLYAGRRATVMGLGRHGGGVAAARYLAEAGALVTISDLADRAALADSLAELDGLPITGVKLGHHDPADFHADFVVVNPAVPPEHPSLQIARAAGAQLTSEIELFLDACPARVIAVTGSNGKSTTCSMLAAILVAGGLRTWLGGNIGHSLLGDLPKMAADDWVVLELSSFQLAHLTSRTRLPELAVVTNCSPNHLDWHGSFEAYVLAKQRLLGGQAPGRAAILNQCDPVVGRWFESATCRVLAGWPLDRVPQLEVPGEHNCQNAACAAAAATACGIEHDMITAALSSYGGLPHRTEFVAQVAGRRFFNDSKSTSPAATIAALRAIGAPIWLLAGGESKGATFDGLAAEIAQRTRGAAVFGAARDQLYRSIIVRDKRFNVSRVETLRGALAWCWPQSQEGDAIVLSPACSSHDQFLDYRDRGEAFRALVREIESCAAK